MQVLIEIDEKNLAALKNAGASVLGTEKDLLLSTVFGKEDIKAFLTDMLSDGLYSQKNEDYAKELQKSTKLFDKIVDEVFHRLNNEFDAAIGINNDFVEMTMDAVFDEHAKTFIQERESSFNR